MEKLIWIKPTNEQLVQALEPIDSVILAMNITARQDTWEGTLTLADGAECQNILARHQINPVQIHGRTAEMRMASWRERESGQEVDREMRDAPADGGGDSVSVNQGDEGTSHETASPEHGTAILRTYGCNPGAHNQSNRRSGLTATHSCVYDVYSQRQKGRGSDYEFK